MASRKSGARRTRQQRPNTNIFTMFDQDQIQEFKEAFNLIDQDHDGFISGQDLKVDFQVLIMHSLFQAMLASLGKEVDDKLVETMLGETRGPINFTMFLTLFGEKLMGTDPEEVLKDAFKCFDETNNGKGLIFFLYLSPV
jgi:Ca2+-binding EF-hand superfamily protein